MTAPLDGVRVLDLTRHLPGPYCTQVMAQLGADVIKLEPPTGDPVRHLPPFDEAGVGARFRALNRGKRSLVLDLKHPDGPDLLRQLAGACDVLVEGFRPGVLDRFGVGHAALRETYPRLITCGISGYGQHGPYRDRAGHDVNYQAYAGSLGLSVGPDGTPVLPTIQTGDVLASFAAITGILAALVERARTGVGRTVDAAMLDALVSAQGLHLLPHLAGERATPGATLLGGGAPCYGVFQCQDGGSIALGALEPKFWERFCAQVERPEWLTRAFDPGLREDLRALFATRPRDAWRIILEEAECCASGVLSYDEVPQDPQVIARGLVGPTHVGPPVQFVPPVPEPDATVAARPGQDTRDVLRALLEADDAQLDAWIASGVVA